jgi:hypothetical protein
MSPSSTTATNRRTCVHQLPLASYRGTSSPSPVPPPLLPPPPPPPLLLLRAAVAAAVDDVEAEGCAGGSRGTAQASPSRPSTTVAAPRPSEPCCAWAGRGARESGAERHHSYEPGWARRAAEWRVRRGRGRGAARTRVAGQLKDGGRGSRQGTREPYAQLT